MAPFDQQFFLYRPASTDPTRISLLQSDMLPPTQPYLVDQPSHTRCGDRVRYTISPSARREVLRRLLVLNHKRAAEGVVAAASEAKNGKSKEDSKINRP